MRKDRTFLILKILMLFAVLEIFCFALSTQAEIINTPLSEKLNWDNTNPVSPEPPTGEEWINVTLPQEMFFSSDPMLQHLVVKSKNYTVTNHSGRPVRVSVEDFKLTGANGVLKNLALYGRIPNNAQAAEIVKLYADDGSGAGIFGQTLLELDSPAPNPSGLSAFGHGEIGTLAFEGETLSEWQQGWLGSKAKYVELDSSLKLRLTALNLDGGEWSPAPDPDAPVNNGDGTIDFMGKKWSVIKGPEKMGEGNYMIAMRESIAFVRFHDTFDRYFERRGLPVGGSLGANGYNNSLVRSILREWSEDNIWGTSYEKYILTASPYVITHTLFWEWGGFSNSVFLRLNQPEAFPTTAASGRWPTAFLMSGSDVSNGEGIYGDLTEEALAHLKGLASKGIKYMWLRSPGNSDSYAASLDLNFSHVDVHRVDNPISLVPSLVVHID
ncbi:MAG: hypothetical protein FWH31_05295 [Streptococcaceae bacterium]|nr:hypothetical protein [Streptococcaceae bacterium]